VSFPIQHIAFRIDASNQIGTGHFMRCLTLADGLKKHGAHIRFVCRNLPEYLHKMLVEKGYEFLPLVSSQIDTPLDELAHASWLGVTQEQDAIDSVQALSDWSWDWLIVDHYALDARWESKLRQIVKHILVIDDIADREHDCDILLDQNFYTDMQTRYIDKVPSHCRLLLGPHYALLRAEFRELHQQVKPRSGLVKHVLVFFGGIDSHNYTGRTIEALSEIEIPDLHVDVVIGSQHPYCEEVESVCKKHGFILHVQTDKMAELMASADYAIGAGGSATWERCCLGLPTLILSLAYNQIEIAKGLDILGAGKYIDIQNNENSADFPKIVFSVLRNNKQMKLFSEKAYSVVDGQGVDRLCEAMAC